VKELLFKLGKALLKVKWVKWLLILVYTAFVHYWAQTFGDVVMCFVIYAFVVFVVNQAKSNLA